MKTPALSNQIFALAEQRSFGQPYPVYVSNLREIGVESYTVSVSNHDRRIFSGTHQPALEIPGTDIVVECARYFDEVALKAALHRTQSGQSNYPKFLSEIAAAGVHFYIANVNERTVTYFGQGPGDHYEEAIPKTADQVAI